MIWVKMMEMIACLNQLWKKIDRYLSLQGSTNASIFEYALAYTCNNLDVRLYAGTFFFNWSPNTNFLLLFSLPLGNAKFTIFAKDAPMTPIKHTTFTRVSARDGHLILGSQRGVLIRGRCSFKGGTH